VRKIDGEQRRRVSDWGPSLQAATAETIEAVFEAFLLEVRAGLEGASPKATEIRHDSAAVATLAGTRLAGLRLSADRKQELGSRLLAQARSVGSHLNAMEVAGKPAASADNHAAFTTIGDSLRDAAKITEGSGGPPPETAQ
jgi:hypothetical protein